MLSNASAGFGDGRSSFESRGNEEAAGLRVNFSVCSIVSIAETKTADEKRQNFVAGSDRGLAGSIDQVDCHDAMRASHVLRKERRHIGICSTIR
jgi:hypothetical protein